MCAYREKNVHEVLQLTVARASHFLQEFQDHLEAEEFSKRWVGYLALGQSATTLSAGRRHA